MGTGISPGLFPNTFFGNDFFGDDDFFGFGNKLNQTQRFDDYPSYNYPPQQNKQQKDEKKIMKLEVKETTQESPNANVQTSASKQNLQQQEANSLGI